MSKERVIRNLKNNIAMENFKEINQKHRKIKKTLQSTLTLAICAFSVTGVVFAKDISTTIYNNFFLTGKGMETAMNEGYIENTNMEYENSNSSIENIQTGEVIEDIETKVKVDEFVMDDFNLSMTFDVELSEKAKEVVSAEEVWKFNFPDLIISDENNIVLYCQNSDVFNEFSKENNLGYNSDEGLENGKYIGSGVNIVPIVREGNNVKVVYNIYTGGNSCYPKSKKLKIQMKNIKISKEEGTTMGGEEITLTGDWNFEIDVPEKMYNRQTSIYTQTSTTNDEYNVTSATLYDTGMKIELKVKSENMPEYPITDEYRFYETLDENDELKSQEMLDYIEWKKRQTDEYLEYTQKVNELFNINIYLTNSKGEKFEKTQGPSENGSMHINEEGFLEYEGMFDLTKYDQTDEVKVHIDYNGVQEEITIEKKEDK